MRSSHSIRRGAASGRSGRAAGALAAPRALYALRLLRILRVVLCTLPLAWVLGGGCTVFYSTNHHHDDDDNNGGTTVVITSDTAGGSGGETVVGGLATIDPAQFELSGSAHGFLSPDAPSGGRAPAGEPDPRSAGPIVARDDGGALVALSPAQLWPPERIGDRELAAFAAAVLLVNEDRLHLPEPASRLRYVDTRVANGVATVRFSDPVDPTRDYDAVFAPSGDLVSIEHSTADRIGDLR